MTTLKQPATPPRVASQGPSNLIFTLPDGAAPASPPAALQKAEVTREAAEPFDAARDQRRIRRDTALHELQFAGTMAWAGLKIIAALIPIALLIAWVVEVFMAFRHGGPHTTFAVAGLAVLVLFGALATAVERVKNHRAAQHVHLHHHRGRW
ncbi:hypothetical protein [Deinococcus soli (ex Cha et al. 2016)]|uniref:hypothetical protein n=1 Tax=Deinococcus soli (ex Cha et al. 2016) TaxID=1309411 RepID=UPI00166BA09A|nr:hypothetical protein [Deinococcus soli (ex Cha et al. 2016)]GGB73723.1 hypothetical protein GCM10008019_32400 [Deinococcus soli (ex Cha et al. 2016)]